MMDFLNANMVTGFLKIFVRVCAIAWLIGCDTRENKCGYIESPRLLHLPDTAEKVIVTEFPGALPYRIGIDSLLLRLSDVGIRPENILWGQSVCVDDVTNTKNKSFHPEIKGPFTFGGLGGFPFAGITGMEAFAHHVPEDGTALLFFGAHIGYSMTEGWGKILRHEQHNPTSCCGALCAALDKLRKNEIKPGVLSEDDYQEQFIEQLALRYRLDIVNEHEPLVALTQVVAREAVLKMTEYAKKVHERNFSFAVVVVGVIINTDYQFDDYLWIDYISIKDIKKDVWVKLP
jgi:hypothetical protein